MGFDLNCTFFALISFCRFDVCGSDLFEIKVNSSSDWQKISLHTEAM